MPATAEEPRTTRSRTLDTRDPGKVINILAVAFTRCRDGGQMDVESPEQFAFLVLGPSLDRASVTGDRR